MVLLSAPCLLLLALGRWQQRLYQRSPRLNRSPEATSASSAPLPSVGPDALDSEELEPEQGATRGRLASCWLALWSLAVLAGALGALGLLAGGAAMAVGIWQSCQQEGWPALVAFLLCICVEAAAFGAHKHVNVF